MLKVHTIFIIYIVTVLSSCQDNYLHKKFISTYNLNKYDTIYVTSSISCGGCVDGFFRNRTISPNSILVFDETSSSEFIKKIYKYHHVHISQNILDKEFDSFANIVILARKGNEYYESMFPVYE